MKRPQYKKVILDIDEANQLDSYLDIAVCFIADHAKEDAKKFRTKVRKQLNTQKLKHKGKL